MLSGQEYVHLPGEEVTEELLSEEELAALVVDALIEEDMDVDTERHEQEEEEVQAVPEAAMKPPMTLETARQYAIDLAEYACEQEHLFANTPFAADVGYYMTSLASVFNKARALQVVTKLKQSDIRTYFGVPLARTGVPGAEAP